jgi:hypothetical protein
VSLDPLRRWEQRFGALPLPSPLVWAVLVALFLGFGVLMGRTAGGDAVDSLASERAPLKVLVAQGVTGGASSTPSSSTASSSTAETPPPAEAETTPEPAPAPAESSAPVPASKASSPPSGESKKSSDASKGASKASA